MTKVKNRKFKEVQVRKTVVGNKLKIAFAADGIISFRVELFDHFESVATQLTATDANAVQTIMRVALLSEVYAKAGESHNDTVRVTRAQACAIILALVHSNNPLMIELKAALLKAL